ncbi:MAG: DUF6320 domain-containing protein [Eubacteriales bacterium]|nr:DUF6320 domain-containing protein [Eubacteriales bacterium]
MRYCNHCQVHIRGKREKCPLCENILSNNGNGNQQEEIYPEIPPAYEGHLAIRIMAFISITTVVISFSIQMIFPTNINWPLFVVFALLSMWLSLIVVVKKRHNIPKSIMWQVMIVSLLSIFWDWQTGWRGWAFDYVIPTAYVTAMFVMYVTAKIMKLSVRDYITYALLDGLFGVIPVLFILFNWINIIYPSILCVAISIIFLSAIFIFQGENIKTELNRRMHI